MSLKIHQPKNFISIIYLAQTHFYCKKREGVSTLEVGRRILWLQLHDWVQSVNNSFQIA